MHCRVHRDGCLAACRVCVSAIDYFAAGGAEKAVDTFDRKQYGVEVVWQVVTWVDRQGTSVNASSVADLSGALNTVHLDLPGDWYRDPWGWPEIYFAVNDEPDLLRSRLDDSYIGAAAHIDVPKEGYSVRPAVVLDPLDRLAYQAVVGRLSVSLIGSLDSNVYGWRLPVKDPQPGVYWPNDKQWDQYRASLSAGANLNDVGLKTDVVSCFASIPIDRVMEVIESRIKGKKNRPAVDRLGVYLDHWQRIPRRSGLPQRCQASSVLANMYLSALDDILSQLAETWTFMGISFSNYARWMDDIWVFGSDPGALRKIQVALANGMADLGLHMNTGKTKLLEGPELIADALQIEHSAVDDALEADPQDLGPLEELVERIVDRKEDASRTSVRFATERMRKHKQFSRVPQLVEVAQRLPHAADALARLFRDAGQAPDLEDWYLHYCKSPWAELKWPVAQFGTMFSSKRPAGRKVGDYLSEVIADGKGDLQLTALAAHRLERWNRKEARVVIADAVQRADNPHIRRVLALAGLAAGHSQTQVRRWLREFPENDVTLRLLESRNFAKLPEASDFVA